MMSMIVKFDVPLDICRNDLGKKGGQFSAAGSAVFIRWR
jgi:hypothetical protein